MSFSINPIDIKRINQIIQVIQVIQEKPLSAIDQRTIDVAKGSFKNKL